MIVTRFAPSPTGEPHIGNFRTALLNWLLARQNQGKFFLRIEDTDRKRYVENSIKSIKEGLEWLGLDYDDIYIQSQRLEIYHKYAQELIAKKNAYYCFCSEERLNKIRELQKQNKKPPKYDRHCLSLNEEEIKNRIDNQEKYVIRFKIPENEIIEFTDIIRGKIKIHTKDLDDFILIKSDGFPTYQLASVLDDNLMHVTHVIRGEEWISSVPKHILIYKSLGMKSPQYAHLPLILAPNKSKLSKRTGDVSLLSYRDKGYLKEAIINFMILLGWNPGDDRELFSIEELLKEFSLEKLNKSASVFNIDKLRWFNAHYIRQMDIKSLTIRCIPYLEKANLIKLRNSKYYNNYNKEEIPFEKLQEMIKLEQNRIKILSEISDALEYFFHELVYDKKLLLWKNMNWQNLKESLSFSISILSEISDQDWQQKILEDKIKKAIVDNNKQNGDILWPLRVALCGRKNSPSPFEIAAILGKKESLKRLNKAILKI